MVGGIARFLGRFGQVQEVVRFSIKHRFDVFQDVFDQPYWVYLSAPPLQLRSCGSPTSHERRTTQFGAPNRMFPVRASPRCHCGVRG